MKGLYMDSAKDPVCAAHSGIESKIQSLEDSDAKQWEAIEKLQNRLPVWATIIISLLTFLLGLSIGFITIK